MILTKKAWVPQLDEIHTYIDDLQRITLLRDKCSAGQERERYDNILHVMQEVLLHLNEPPKK